MTHSNASKSPHVESIMILSFATNEETEAQRLLTRSRGLRSARCWRGGPCYLPQDCRDGKNPGTEGGGGGWIRHCVRHRILDSCGVYGNVRCRLGR